MSSQTSLSAPVLVDSYRLHRSKLSILPIKHPSSLSACANLDLSSLSISRCDQVAHRFTSLHFKDHQHVKTYSSKISPRSRPVDLVDFIQTHLSTPLQTRLSTPLKISTCRLRSKLTCRLRSKPQRLPTSSKLTCQLNSSTSSKRTRQLYLKLHANLNLSISSTPLENLTCRSSQKSQLSFAVSSTPSSPSACAHLDLSSLSISRCFQQLSNSRQRHFKTSLVDLVDLVDLFPQNDPKTHSKPHAFVNVFSRSTFSVTLSQFSLKLLELSYSH